MAEKLRNKYQEALKERDMSLYEVKRIRHDFDSYVQENDQVNLKKNIYNLNVFIDFYITQFFCFRTSFV